MAALEGGAAHNNWSFPAGNPPLNKLPSNDDRKLEHQQWQTASFLKEQCHPHEKRLRWSDCEEAGAECVHPSEFFTPSLDISPSAAPVHGCKGGITATTRPFSVVCGESQHQFPPRCMAMAELAGDRASSTSPETLPIHDKAEQFFLPLQHAIGSLPDTHTHGSSISFGAPRLEPYREFAHYDAWENARLKAEIVSHPLYEQLLAAHVACLRVATPVEHLGSIDVQLRSSHNLAARYSMLGRNVSLGVDEKEELDHFMASYLLLLQSFKDQLQEHVRVHAMEAIVGCLELRQALVRLTGVSLGEPSGATMSDDETETSFDTEFSQFDPMFVAGHDVLGLGPLIPTETERTLMERVRQELKIELKQGYRSRIADVREEILRKRRAGKLPSDTTFALKNWWKTHSKWPYPTEDEKAKLVQETGLELKQINNWFINQRKRNWHNNNSSSPSLPKSDVGSAGQSSNISLSLNSESLRPPSHLQ